MKILYLFFLLLIPLVLIVSVSRYSAKEVDWKLPGQEHILFMGASHIVYGVNDSIIPSSINLASLSERYMYTYIKLKHVLESNHQVDTVFLDCAPNDLSDHADEKYFIDNEMVSFYARYYPLFDLSQWELYRENFGSAVSLLFRKTAIDYIKGLDYKYFIDGFIPYKQVMRDTTFTVEEKGNYKYGNRINYKYLRMIINLCKENKCVLYLVYSPHIKPEEYYDVDYYYESYKRYFSDVPLLDYSHFRIEDGEWCDATHLNEKGAKRFTQRIKRFLELRK